MGREREIAAPHDLLARVEQGRGQVVGSIGAPGVGKSGLCYEFTQSQRPPGWLILASSPVAYGKNIPYFQVIDLLKAYFQLNAGAERQTIRDMISGKLQTLCQLAPSCGFYCVCVTTSATISSITAGGVAGGAGTGGTALPVGAA